MKVHRNQDELQDTIEGYKALVEEQKKEIFFTFISKVNFLVARGGFEPPTPGL